MKLRLTLTAAMVTTLAFSSAAAPVTSTRPQPRPTGAAWDAIVRANSPTAKNNTRTGLIPWTPTPSSRTDPNTGAQYQSCPC
jgi:hypothetical protein